MKKYSFLNLLPIIVALLVLSCNACTKDVDAIELSANGTWCWFSDPRAIYDEKDGGRLITGFVSAEGNVEALEYNFNNKTISTNILYPNLEKDDHNNPAFALLNDGTIQAYYTKHHNDVLYMNKTNNGAWEEPVPVNPNGQDDLAKFGDDKYTYANPYVLKNENDRIYMFGRWIGFKPNISWSDDGGLTWSAGRVMICPQPFSWGQRPYVKYYSDGVSKIHITFTDGHPRDEPTNSLYYACYYNGAFHRANGEVICTIDEMPFEPKDATLVYDAKVTGDRAWVYDLCADAHGNPSIAYARYPTEEEHIYHYAWFDGEKWHDKEVVNSGKWFPQTPDGKSEREPHYSGGLSIDPNQQSTVYVSREVNGIFEIEKFQLLNDLWQSNAITSNSTSDQVRPYVVKNCTDKTILLWLAVDKYVHYTDFHTSVQMQVFKK